MNVIDSLFTEYGGNVPLYKAGRVAPPGEYLEVETGRLVDLDEEDILPASCDGRVASYIRRPMEWRQVRDAYGAVEIGGSVSVEEQV